MTKEELSKFLGVSENEIIHHFPRLQEKMKKRNIILLKKGKGGNAVYGIITADLSHIEDF
jgi:hypothetical protein